MDLTRFSLNPALAENARVQSPFHTPFYEKLLSTLFESNENAYVKSNVEKDRGIIFMMPAFYWLTSVKGKEPGSRALALAPDAESAAALFRASRELAANLQDSVRIAHLGSAAGTAGAADDAGGLSDSPGVTNLVDANLVVADFDTFREAVSAGTLSGRSYGFVILDHAEVIAELPYEILKKTIGHLLPSWERRTLVIAAKHTPRAKNLAWEFADNPREISLQESLGFAGLMKAQSYDVAEKDKVRFLLSLAAGNQGKTMAVFCNLKRTAQELAFRLQKNAVPVDYIVGNLMADRKRQIAQKALSQASGKGFVLVLTDDGAKGLEGMEFPILVNFDIPLEPEFYASRVAYISKNPDEAQLFNFVCERYMYGVPAIERLIDAPLNPQPLPNPESLPEDQSAGFDYIPPERPERGRPSGRGGRPGRFGDSDRSERPARDERAERSERPVLPEQPERPESAGSGRPERSGAARQRPSRWDTDRPSPARQTSRERKPGAPSSSQSLESTENLYALSTEERLALFRKKYEKTVLPRDTAGAEQGSKSGAGKGGSRNRKARPNGARNSGDAAARGANAASHGKDASPNERPRPMGTTSAATQPSEPAAPVPQPLTQPVPQTMSQPAAKPQVSPEPEQGSKGLFGRLQGLFGGKKES